MVNERYSISNARCREALLPGKEQPLVLLRQPKLLQQVQVLVVDLGSLPSRDLKSFSRHGGSWSGVSEEPGARWHASEWRRKVEVRSSALSLGKALVFLQRGEKMSGEAKRKKAEEEDDLYLEHDSLRRWIEKK
jgi:hypothetical protein